MAQTQRSLWLDGRVCPWIMVRVLHGVSNMRTSASALASVVIVLVATARTYGASGACEVLAETYSSSGTARAVSIAGREHVVRVYWDGRAPGRAAAALLAAALRHALRYRRVELAQEPSLCTLATRLWPLKNAIGEPIDELALVPAAPWGAAEAACAALARAAGEEAAPPRLRVRRAGAAPARLALLVHLAAGAEAEPDCRLATQWSFFTNETALTHCGFIQKSTLPVIMYFPLERNITANELATKLAAAGVRLRAQNLGSDAKPRRELLALLREGNVSFLFLDYDIWTNQPRVRTVEPPPGDDHLDQTETMRLADDILLRMSAPKLIKLFYEFAPTPKNLLEVLELEATTPSSSIEEAACAWANENPSSLKQWLTVMKPVYEIAVFLCENDPDNNEYIKAMNLMFNVAHKSTISKFLINVDYPEVNCENERLMMKKFTEKTQSKYWSRLVGVVAAGAGTLSAARVAAALDTALVLYDVSGHDPLPNAARVSTGRLSHLTLAIRHFLSIHSWKRLAVLSDDTQLATALVDSLRPNLTLKNIPVKPSVKVALQQLFEKQARIFFVNSNSTIATSVLCIAHDLGMTNTDHVWILREWHGSDIICGNRTVSKRQVTHFTISFCWRGGNSSSVLGKALDRLWAGRAWPMHAAPLADALTLLLHSFEKFLHNYPERQEDLHGGNATGLLWKSLDKLSPEGISQILKWDQHGIERPLVFVDKWYGRQRKPVAVWLIENDKVLEYQRPERSIFTDDIPSDGSVRCLTKSAGDDFKPHCYDNAVWTAIAAVIVSCPLLLLLRRIRRDRVAQRDRRRTARLIAVGEQAAATLSDHLVDRGELEMRHEIGAGRFGRVSFAILRKPGRPAIAVAAKALREEATPSEEREFLNEACVLASLRHESIVRLVGVCATGGPPLLLMEHAFFGDLAGYLQQRRHLLTQAAGAAPADAEARHVSAEALTRLGRAAAAALAHLAAQRVLHRDVRASNCLVDEHRSLKLADFGMARRTEGASGSPDEYASQRRGLFPVLWMAPESLQRGVFSAASETWALGVLLLELATLGARPYGAWPPPRVLRYVLAGGRPPLPPGASPETRRLLTRCWRRAPEQRPTAREVAAALGAAPALLRPAPPAPGPDPDDYRHNQHY